MDCVKCSMPIDDKTKCTCDSSVCYHCCDCGEDCDGCNCSSLSVKEEVEAV